MRERIAAERLAGEARSRYRVKLHGMTFEQRAAIEGKSTAELRGWDKAAELVERPFQPVAEARTPVVRSQAGRFDIEIAIWSGAPR